MTNTMALLAPISLSDKLLVIKHLATLTRAGIPIDETLKILLEETTHRKLQTALSQILRAVQSGESLAKSLAEFPRIFDPLFTHMVEVGEKSGTLEQNLSYLVLQYEKDAELVRKIRGAMLYPILVVAAAVSMSFGITYFIIPKMTGIFATLNVELPLTTRLLIRVSEIVRAYGGRIALLLFSLVSFFGWLVHQPKIRPRWHGLLLHIPIVGKLNRELNLARFSRTLGILLKSGLPLVEALSITEQTLENDVYRRIVRRVRSGTERGQSIATVLHESPARVVPVMATRMIGIGEHTGKLDEMLLYVSSLYEQSVDDTTKNLSTVLGPLLLVVIGGMIAFVALSIITPIYKLTGSLRR